MTIGTFVPFAFVLTRIDFTPCVMLFKADVVPRFCSMAFVTAEFGVFGGVNR